MLIKQEIILLAFAYSFRYNRDMNYKSNIEDLLYETLSSVNRDEESIYFTTVDGYKYRMYHERDCCEEVRLEEIHGDLNDLVGSPILKAGKET